MAGYYGYDPKDYMPDSSVWERTFGIAAQTILKLPEVIEVQRALDEGRETNAGIYEGFKNELNSMDDNDVRTYFGSDKATLLKLAKPGRNEGSEYFPRFAKITGEGLKSVYAMKNLQSAQGEIQGQNLSAVGKQNFENSVEGQMGIGGVAGKFGSAAPKGNMAPSVAAGPQSSIAKPASPEDIQTIGRKYNVPMDKLQPEMDRARASRTAQQVQGIDLKGNQTSEYQKAFSGGEPVEAGTLSTIGTLPTQYQEAQAMTDAAKTENDRYKASTDRMKAGNDANKEKRQSRNELLSLKKTYQNEIKLAQTELSKVTDDLQKTKPFDIDDKDWEKERKNLVSRQKTLTRDLRNAKKEANEADKLLKQENGIPPGTYIDDEVWDVFDQINSGNESDLPGMEDPQYKSQNQAYSIADIANKTWGISISPEIISNEIKNGSTPLQILQALFENAMGQ